jgi:quinol monooxygenase YgiN
VSLIALEAFEYVNKDKVEAYERMGIVIDKLVKDSEPGMLVHALTKLSETNDEVVYRWLEVFDGEQALEAHFENPHVISHVAAMKDGILCSNTKLILYVDWEDDKKAIWQEKLSGGDFTFAPVVTSFFADR